MNEITRVRSPWLAPFWAMPPLGVLCLSLVLLFAAPPSVLAQQQNMEDMMPPPRVGMVSGNASFLRPGAEHWAPAEVNTPLAVGDGLYTAADTALEIQIGTRAYLRMAQNAMLTLLSNERGLIQFKITSGIAAFDLRSLPASRAVELDTPAGAFNIDAPGYYRVEIVGDTTHLIVRRGGEATVTLPDGSRRLIAPSQEVVIDPNGDVGTYVAPEPDPWDTWNYARSEDLIDAVSNRYVSPEVYGTDDLDHYGNWRVTPDYGPVWIPAGMPADWAPYSTGSWVWDPIYAWTWVDTAPWGWAPYHYGRWINLSGFWAWAPGPRQLHPSYAPALVAFFHEGGTLQASFGAPGVSWVALSWGEPCVPWWGRSGFVGKPWWGGWGGPRVINNVVIEHNTVINNVTNIRYRNLDQRRALIAVSEKSFGHGRITGAFRPETAHSAALTPIVGLHPVHPTPASLTPTSAKVSTPATGITEKPAVVPHNTPQRTLPWRQPRREEAESRWNPATNRIIVPAQTESSPSPLWSPFGKSTGPERNTSRQAPAPPRPGIWATPQASPAREERQAPKPTPSEAIAPIQRPRGPTGALPGQAAGRPAEPRQRWHEAAPILPQAAPKVAVPQAPPQAPPQREPQVIRPEPPHGKVQKNVQSDPPTPLPGRPANQLYQRKDQRSEQKKQ